MFKENINLVLNSQTQTPDRINSIETLDNPSIDTKSNIEKEKGIQTQRLYSGHITMENPVKNYWDIKLYVHVDKDGDCTFKAQLTSQKAIKLPDGRTIQQSEVIDECDFEDKEKIIRKKLRKKGVIDDNIYRGIVSYIEYLKSTDQYDFLQNVISITFNENRFKNIVEESIEFYEILVQEIKQFPLAFKLSSSNNIFKVGEHDGVLEEDYSDTGYSAVVIEGDILKSILGIEGKSKFENIIRTWRDSGLLLSGDKLQNRMTTRYTFCSRYRKSSYVIKVDKQLCGFVFEYPCYKTYDEFINH